MVELRNVTKHYPIVGRSDAVQALKGICIGEGYPVGPIRKGEFIILRGPSGGGKTTLLNIIGCIDTVTSGSIGMLGHEITASASDAFLADLRLRSIGFVFQTFKTAPLLTPFQKLHRLHHDSIHLLRLRLAFAAAAQDPHAGHAGMQH
jgi:putative ABC transport system ATP-binding protein